MTVRTLRIYSQLAICAAVAAFAYGIGYRQGLVQISEASIKSAESVPGPTKEADSDASVDDIEPETADQSLEIATPQTAVETALNPREQAFEDARADLESALEAAQSLTGREQASYIGGLFAFIAQNSAPLDAITIATELENPSRAFALQSLVSEWTGQGGNDEGRRGNHFSRMLMGEPRGQFGLEVQLAGTLAQTNADPQIAKAWIESFSNHPGRSEIVARLAPAQPDFDPAVALAEADNWTEWERSRFEASLIENWSQRNPSEAWDWYANNAESVSTGLVNTLLESWARRDSESLAQSMGSFVDPEHRLDAIEAISNVLAQRDTDRALDWVESLADDGDRDAAYQAVYNATPKGIGALLQVENGFPKIREILPGGALESTDIQAGDLIVEARESEGAAQNLYGTDLRRVVDQLRGPPGSEVEIRVLRNNPDTGRLEEHRSTVVRDLLILHNEGKG